MGKLRLVQGQQLPVFFTLLEVLSKPQSVLLTLVVLAHMLAQMLSLPPLSLPLPTLMVVALALETGPHMDLLQ